MFPKAITAWNSPGAKSYRGEFGLNDLLCAGYAAEQGQGNCEAGAEGRRSPEHLESEGRALLVRSAGRRSSAWT